MFIETENPAKYGSSVRLFITFPGREDRSEIAATVRWAKPGGMGVQFGVMGAKDTHSLTKLLGA